MLSHQISYMLVLSLCFMFIFSVPRASSEVDLKDVPIAVIMDIDADPSDFPALLYLLKHPGIDVQAVTVSPGISYIEEGVNNLLRLLDYMGFPEIQAAGGSDLPLETDNAFLTPWRDGSYNFYGVDIPETDLQPSSLNASQLIISMLKIQPMTLVMTGPLTNLARALQSDPSISENITKLYSMGGAVTVDGNVGYESDIPNFAAEWNYYVDPHAADIVFSSDIPIVLVPLDATNDVPQTQAFENRQTAISQTKASDLALQMYITDLYFWDQLTAVVLTNPEVVMFESHHIDIVVSQVDHEGPTVSNSYLPANAEVAISADAVKFEDLYLGTINDGVISIESPTISEETPGFGFMTFILGLLTVISRTHRIKDVPK